MFRDPGTIRQRKPGWQARRSSWLLRKLSSVAPPRVQAAVFSTIWNRWTTARRFQRTSHCLLCGCEGGDSIEHYSRCRVVRNTCHRVLNCDPNIFAALHSFVLATPLITTRNSLAIAGLLVYATYTTVNALRHQGNNGAICERTAHDAISQAIREGARSHGFATAVLRSRWSTTNNDEQQIPQRPLQAFQKDIESLRA